MTFLDVVGVQESTKEQGLNVFFFFEGCSRRQRSAVEHNILITSNVCSLASQMRRIVPVVRTRLLKH